MTRIISWLMTVLASLLQTASAADTLTLGIVPQFPALEIHRAWTPIAQAMEEVLAKPVQLKIYSSIPSFERDVIAGGPDIVYLNPYHMVMARRAQKYRPVVRDNAQLLSGILVVQADSPIKSLTDLAGQKIAFPAPNAFGASLLIRAFLSESYGVRFEPSYVQTHSNAYRNVARGEAAAAGGIFATLKREPEDLRQRLRVLYSSPQFAPHPIAVHPRTTLQQQTALTQLFLRLATTGDGRRMLSEIAISEPISADYQRDYSSLEKLGLERYIKQSEAP